MVMKNENNKSAVEECLLSSSACQILTFIKYGGRGPGGVRGRGRERGRARAGILVHLGSLNLVARFWETMLVNLFR